MTSLLDHPMRTPMSLGAVTRVPPAEAPAPPNGRPTSIRLSVRALDAYFGAAHVVRGVNFDLVDGEITAIIGPSGCGKSTLLRCLNRMHETIPGARAEGEVLLDGVDMYARKASATEVRKKVGMVFQRPTPFPTMSIRENVLAGFRSGAFGSPNRQEQSEIVERCLSEAALWDEVKDRLRSPATALSGGQQQRLCIARALATSPEVLLLDEPTASLDPLSTQKIEELLYELRGRVTVVIVTHNMQQAARSSDHTAFMLNGALVEIAPTRQLFTSPTHRQTEDYITGRFG